MLRDRAPISLPCQGAAPWRPWSRARRLRGRCPTRRARTGASRAPAPNGGAKQLELADLTAKLHHARGHGRCWYGYLRCPAGEVDDGLGARGVDGLHHRADPALHQDPGGRSLSASCYGTTGDLSGSFPQTTAAL